MNTTSRLLRESFELTKGVNRCQINFDFEVVGKSEDVLIELMKINAVLIRNYRKVGFTDKEIEKQLIGCVAAGFALEKAHEKKKP